MYKKIIAIATLCGTIIGVGMFGLPYVTAQAGFWPVMGYFLMLSVALTLGHLVYAQIALNTPGEHRLPGYSRLYVSKSLGNITYVSTFIGLTGSLLAYIIIGGDFLQSLLYPVFGGGVFLYSTLFFICGALLVYFGSGPIGKTEFLSMATFFVILILLFIRALPEIQLSNFDAINFDHYLLPYGVVLFSLSGMSVIPEIKEMLGKQAIAIKQVVVIGLLIPIIAYLIFIVTIFGVTGSQTTPEGLRGFVAVLGPGVASFGFIFGIIATFTSFIALAITLKKQFQYDRKLPHQLSWILAVAPAFILFTLGFRNFIEIIGFIGAVTLGIDIIAIIIIYYCQKKKIGKRLIELVRLPHLVAGLLIIMFILGIITEVGSLFS